MIESAELTDPVVRAFVRAINQGDRAAFVALLTPDATMADDGAERDVDDWTEREIFGTNGRMTVEYESDDGRSLVAHYRNDAWGEMRTSWRFVIVDGLITRFETGQA